MGKDRLSAKIIFVSSVFLCLSGNVFADLTITKTVVGSPSPAAENAIVSYNISVQNTGPGNLSDVIIDDSSVTLNNLNFTQTSSNPSGGDISGDRYQFGNLTAGETVTLQLDATVNSVGGCPVIQNSASVSESTNTFNDNDVAADIEYLFNFTDVVTHLPTSFCALCGDGTVTLRVTNPTTTALTNVAIVEDLQLSGLTYIPSSTVVSSGSSGNPGISGTQLTWTSAQLSALSSLASGASVDITFGVRRLDEGLITADRRFLATADFDVLPCIADRQSINTGQFEVPINQPEPNVLKDGRNFDARQSDYSDPIFGNLNDDVIWRVNVRNAGNANMEALLINDAIDGNFSINFICPTEVDALAVASSNGVVGGACISMASAFNVVDPFGNATNPDDITANTNNAFVYYVGRILTAHTNNTNSIDVSWGCDADSPTGGLITIPATNGGSLPSVDIDDTGDLSTTVDPSQLQITQTVTGSNTSQPLGSKGLVTVTINNQTGGTINNVELQNLVPDGYVVDGTFGSQTAPEDCDCTVVFDPAYGLPGSTYPGFIDTVVRDDVQRDNGDPLDDLTPHFTFTSSTVGADANQVDLLRHGDVITLTFGIVMIDPVLFDVVADLELSPEVSPGTDPANALNLSSTAMVDFDAADVANGLQNQSEDDVLNFNSNPEDLDVAISDALFILTNDPGTSLTLNVLLTNNGGHDADDHITYVTFGQAMTVDTVPNGCIGPVANPPPQPHWNDPSSIPTTAAVYACDRGVLDAGNEVTFTFTVIKTNAAADDDLTFRADVFGEVTLFDGSLLTFPSPPTIADTTPNIAQLANNYSFDAVRSKVLGFNLVKSAWYCAEDGATEPGVPANVLTAAASAPNTPPLTGNLNSQIGEDCTYRIESGGWFGFDTPGFTLIAVEDVLVTDDLPDGQGFIPFAGGQDFNFNNTSGINLEGANGGAGTLPLDEADITWNFNATGPGILEKDKFFRVDFKTRMLNDSVDFDYSAPGVPAPNFHANRSINIARTSFTASFESDIGDDAIFVNDGSPSIPGYPVAGIRTVDLTEIEPNLIVTKQVCNETLNTVGIACGDFADSINNGDTDDSYIYRITLENQTSTPIRSPAFNVISTDTLDASDLMQIVNFSNDGLDNDGDTQIDEADEATLFASIPDNVIGSAIPAVITVNESFNTLLQQVDSGPTNRITFYYRVNPDDAIAPLQTLTNTVSLSYDSLEGGTGNQLTLPLVNTTVAPDDVGRARIYTSIAQNANVQMIPLQAQPKAVIAVSNSPLGGSPQGVVIGEEIRYQLTTLLPVTNLKKFVIRDKLPTGMRCVEDGPVVVMGAGGPHADAGFMPNGNVTPVCSPSGDEIVWDFGDRELTMAGGASRFPFVIDFVARIENVAVNREGTVLTNGGGAGGTDVTASYENEVGTTIVLDFDPVDVAVQEPDVTLTKAFAVTNSDAGDVLTITVTATNNGTAAAYNLRVLDDLVGSGMTFIPGSLSGTDPPDTVDTVTLGANKPIFSWNELDGAITNPEYEITPLGGVRSFTFDVRVDTSAQPLEILDNTIHSKWDSLPGQSTSLNASNLIGISGSATGLRTGVLPNAGDALNDYETTAVASTSVLPLTLNKNDLNPALIPAIGAHKNFEVVITLPEGTTNDLVVTDNLITTGLSYALSRNTSFDVSVTFNDIVSINGAAPSEAAFTGQGLGALPIDNATGVIEWNIGTVITSEENDPTENSINPSIVINYFARVNNDLDTDDTDTLQNSVTVTYDNGETGAEESLTDITAVQTVVEPSLVVSKTVTNTSGAVAISVGDVLEFRISLDNTAGTAAAFDINIVDTLPVFLLLDAGFTPTASNIPSGIPIVGFNAIPAGAPGGPLIWGRDNADNGLDVPAGQTVVLKYQAVVQPGTPPNANIVNSAVVDWTSLNNGDASSLFERNGAGCPTITLPNDYCAGPVEAIVVTGLAEALFKANPIDKDISIGEQFSYTITVPEIAQGTALFDVQVLDDLTASAADLSFISVTKVPDSLPWVPANAGTPSDLIIKDVTNGIDIPAGEQIEMLVTVVLKNTPVRNVNNVGFDNTATYNFNSIDNDIASINPGSGNTTPALTIVEPDLVLDKRGPAGNVSFNAPISYQLVVENVGTGPAFDVTILDRLPNVPDNAAQAGGTCDVAPVNFNARITTAVDEATLVRDLIRDTDYTATYTPAPTCELVITALTDKARIEASEKFIIDYDATLNVGSESGAALTNIAGVTQWFSLDTDGSGATGEIREYTRTITDGLPVDNNDHEDAFTVTVEASVLTFQKTVSNVTSGLNPGGDASPGDTLRYSILVTNVGPLNLADFSITDELDNLAAPGAFFVPGSMTNFNIPIGADNTNTNINGGANNAGQLDVRNLSIDAAGGANNTVLVEFDVTLLSVITSNTVILSQAQLSAASIGVLLSDDPSVGGLIDPTETLITSAPLFQALKTSQDISGDVNLLQAGDTLSYTLTVKNIGQEDAVNTLLSDQIPTNTTYVADTTTLNGAAIADPSAGVSALTVGMLINAPENLTVGTMRAGPININAADSVAIITFNVMVNLTAIDGTVISNQGFVSGAGEGSGVFPQQPSDNPTTAAVDDPTIDIVGDVALFDVQKTVTLVGDVNLNGIVDPGDVLRYSITATNLGGIAVTNTVLTDAVPASSQYVANSTTLNGNAVADPAANVSPLIFGIAISSSDVTPPLPPQGAGTLSSGQSAFIVFDVIVDATAADGTVISNQGFVSSNELPIEPTDADGIDSNGDQPTDVIVGNSPSLLITKQVFVVGAGSALAGGELEYVVRVTNNGSVPVNNVIITDNLGIDDLGLPVPGQKNYVTNSALLNGLPAGVIFAGNLLTADYSSTYGDLAPASVAELRFRVTLSSALNIGKTISNTADVEWNIPPATASAAVSIDIGGVPGSANLNGQVWHDVDFSNDVAVGETLLQGWAVSLYSNSVLLASAQSDTSGRFQFSGLQPNLASNLPVGNAYELRYVAPGATATTAALGNASSAFGNVAQGITGIVAASGSSIQNLNLPIQPNGVVYNSVLRTQVAGVRLSMINQTRSNKVVPGSCFEDPIQASQVTPVTGWYKFDLNFSNHSLCAEGDEYEIQVLPPADNFIGTTSVIVPPVNPVAGPAQDVINCPSTIADQIPATVLHCENSVSSVPAAASSTASVYALKFLFNNAPVTNQIFNNHIPVDPDLGSAVAISKVAGMQNVTRSQLIPYTITVSNTLAVPLSDLSIVDNYPAGFKYVTGSSRLDKAEVEPIRNGRQLTWNIPTLNVGDSKEIKLLLIAGSGVGEGEYVNTAQMFNNQTGGATSGLASASVRIIPDPTFDCTDIIGKVYDDRNMNAYQDKGEKGIAGIQVATARGLRVTTDKHGRFHITCALVPNETRGSNFIMKLDDRSLPSGYRVTTENPRVQRATRGKMIKFNFGAALHRVVKLDLADGVFEKGTTVLRPQWRSRIELLVSELVKSASILRLSYLGENETESEVDDRLDEIEDIISERWEGLDCCYKLSIEKEVYWRKGHPSDRRWFE